MLNYILPWVNPYGGRSYSYVCILIDWRLFCQSDLKFNFVKFEFSEMYRFHRIIHFNASTGCLRGIRSDSKIFLLGKLTRSFSKMLEHLRPAKLIRTKKTVKFFPFFAVSRSSLSKTFYSFASVLINLAHVASRLVLSNYILQLYRFAAVPIKCKFCFPK